MTRPLPRNSVRTVLRRLCAADLEAFQAYRHDEAVGRFQGWKPLSDPDALVFLKRMNVAPLFATGEWFQIGIADRVSGVLIGDIGLCLSADGQSCEIGFSLRSASQGQGLGTEAVAAAIEWVFEQTGARRLVGVTDARNTASVRLLEAVGMQRLAIEHAVFRDEPCIEYRYAIARPGSD